jgi:hypothetical protein
MQSSITLKRVGTHWTTDLTFQLQSTNMYATVTNFAVYPNDDNLPALLPYRVTPKTRKLYS